MDNGYLKTKKALFTMKDMKSVKLKIVQSSRKTTAKDGFYHEEHEGVEWVKTTAKTIFTMKDMKRLKFE